MKLDKEEEEVASILQNAQKQNQGNELNDKDKNKLMSLIRKRPYTHQYGAIPNRIKRKNCSLPSPSIAMPQHRPLMEAPGLMVVPKHVEYIQVHDLDALASVIPFCQPGLLSPKDVIRKGIIPIVNWNSFNIFSE